jgi:hypothetical protein
MRWIARRDAIVLPTTMHERAAKFNDIASVVRLARSGNLTFPFKGKDGMGMGLSLIH